MLSGLTNLKLLTLEHEVICCYKSTKRKHVSLLHKICVMDKTVYYADYLQLEKITGAQEPESFK